MADFFGAIASKEIGSKRLPLIFPKPMPENGAVIPLSEANGGAPVKVYKKPDTREEIDAIIEALRVKYEPFMQKLAPKTAVILKNGAEETLYGGGDISTYNKIYYTHNEEETPVLDVTGMGDVDDKIVATAGSAEYVAYETTNYVEAFKVNLTLQNSSANAGTSAGDAVTYSFKDANGAELGNETVVIDALNPGESKNVEFYAPIGTATIEAIDSDLNYVPVITLPAIGSDIDVTKKKNRIRVSAASASFNEDGTIHVELTFKNYTSNWITEETDYVQYTYYNAAGTKIKTETLYIGVIDTKKHPVKTFEFDLPATAASVKITKSKIVYWTEWA